MPDIIIMTPLAVVLIFFIIMAIKMLINKDNVFDKLDKKWVAVDDEINELNKILEIISVCDDIENGEEYAYLQRYLLNHINKLKGEQ